MHQNPGKVVFICFVSCEVQRKSHVSLLFSTAAAAVDLSAAAVIDVLSLFGSAPVDRMLGLV